jgi:DNA polymerase III epsilon subunit-like protein
VTGHYRIARWQSTPVCARLAPRIAGMSYFSIDCEASGPVPALYNLLSVGVTAVHREERGHVLGESFYVELKPVFPGFDPAALAVCGLDVERLRREGLEPAEAMARLTRWVRGENRSGGGSPVFVGHNAVFDWSFIAYYYAHVGQPNPFGYKGIDTKSMAMGRLGLPWFETSKEKLQRVLQLPAQDAAMIHRADYDAHYQALILRALLDGTPAAADRTA